MKNKKDLLGGLIIVVLLLLVLITYMSFYNYNKSKHDSKKSTSVEDNSLSMINIYDDFSTFKIDEKDSIDSTKNIIGSYNCKFDDCAVYTNEIFDSLYDSRFLLLKENGSIFVYDFVINKIVSNLYDDIVYRINDTYYIVKKDYKYGIISKAGIEIVNPIYDKILYDNIYDSYIKVKNDNLYGVLDLDNGNIVIDVKYEDIKITDSKYYSVLKDGLWYIIDNTGNVITNGYAYTFSFNKGFIALIDNNLQILKYNKEINEQLNESIISIYEINGYEISRSGSNIYINITNGDNIIKYEYNINRNKLISK